MTLKIKVVGALKWNTRYNDIKNKGRWCPECSGLKKHTIEDCRELAQNKNGKCLSESYVNFQTRMNWECDKNHQWQTTFNCIKSGNNSIDSIENIKFKIIFFDLG